MNEAPDTVVIGAGSAGSVIVRRLIDAGRRVRLLEAGGADTNPAIHDPARLAEIWHSADDWDYFTAPQQHAAGRRLHLPRGKVLGGSHSLNAMIWVRCAPSDYDHWASLGNVGWSWSDVAPVFERIENYDGPATPGRGTEGLLDVTVTYPLNPIQASIIEAAVETGISENDDYNGGGPLDGVSKQQVTIRDGRRLNTWLAYAQPVIESPLLDVTTGAWVHRLLLEDGAVTGVEFEVDGAVRIIHTTEVVLCAGAIDSPRILLRSGIGPADELRALGIDVVADLPGVGRNLHDHLLSPVIFAADDRTIDPPLPGTSVTQSHLFWRSRDGLEEPDTQPIHFSVPMYEPWMSGPEQGFTLMGGIVRPGSRGTVTLAGPDPHDGLVIDPRILEDEEDLDSLVASVRQCRSIGRAPALAAWGARELYPGPDVDDDDELRDYVRRTAITYHHQAGTCKMGSDALAVVDSRLRVHGLTGLTIADASIMPRVTTGNTNAPVIMIAERAAEFLLA